MVQRVGGLGRRVLPAAVAAAALGWLAAGAAALDVSVTDASGIPVEDAVVAAVSLAGAPAPKGERPREIIDQVDKEFVPHVKAVLAGTAISFPNKDNIRHHVYSFSPARKFELPLYKGVPAEPVDFERPGLVVLGCNIHDWMIGYVYVLETPWFGVSGKDGAVRLRDLPSGEIEVRVYHPRAKDPAAPDSRRLALGAADPASASFRLSLKPAIRRPRPPQSGGPDYP